MIGLVNLIGRLNGSFWPKISPIFAFRYDELIQYSREKACCSILLKELNYRPYRVSEWGVLLMLRANFGYINSLSLRDTHRFKSEKMKHMPRWCAIPRDSPKFF
jgi:hypothetical protein